MIKVTDQEQYQAFREEFGSMADDLRYGIAKVKQTLVHHHFKHTNIEGIMYQCFMRGGKDSKSLRDQIAGYKKLCEQNEVGIPEERDLIRMGKQRS